MFLILIYYREKPRHFSPSTYKLHRRRTTSGNTGRRKMGNQQIGGDVDTLTQHENERFYSPLGIQNLVLDPETLTPSAKRKIPTIPKTLITPPDEPTLLANVNIDPITKAYLTKRRGSIAIGERIGGSLDQ